MPPGLPCLDSIFPSLHFALLICLPSPHVSPSVFPTYLLPSLFTSRPLTSSLSLQHLCPCRGGVPEKRKPPGQSATSQMVSKLHLHYLSSPLPLFLYGQRFTMTRCSCDISHLSAADLPAHKSSTYLGKVFLQTWPQYCFYVTETPCRL